MARTQKPCPGCVGTGWREVDRVCLDCQNLIAIGRRERAATPRGDKCILPTVSYAWRRYHAGAGVTGFNNAPSTADLCAALSDFVWACSKPDVSEARSGLPDDKVHFLNESQGGWGEHRLLPTGSLEHLVRFEGLLQSMLTATARAAFQSGRNLLLSLHNGTVGLEEFNKKDGGPRNE